MQENIHNIILIICNYILYVINLIDNDYLRNLYFTCIDYFEINQAQSFLVIYLEKFIYYNLFIYICKIYNI